MKFVLREGIYLHQTRICRADKVPFQFLTSSIKRQTPQRDYYLILERIKKMQQTAVQATHRGTAHRFCIARCSLYIQTYKCLHSAWHQCLYSDFGTYPSTLIETLLLNTSFPFFNSHFI